MAEWRPLHQQFDLRSGLETGGQSYDPPLLPYEKSLIASLGCSEEEYRKFVRYAMQRAHVRPAEYDRIPNVVATGFDPFTAFVVNLVVGVLLTAASILLAPKAPTLEDNKIKGKKLADQIGPSRFNQATSFDNAPSLAELNQPIPIPFGKRGTGADGVLTGGLILAPALVWSRLYAYGAYQAYEGVYVAGEFGVDEPDLGGVLLGTQSVNALGDKDFALYWSSKKGNNRPASPQLYGTEGPGATGTVGRQVFTAPTSDGQFSSGFSMSYVPSGDTTFGTATPIHNGTAHRFNWEIISAPFSATEGSDNRDAREEIQAKRRKIAGMDADVLHIKGPESGQPGTGRAYARRMGFIQHSGSNNEQEVKDKTIVTVNVGDTAIFEIDNNDRVWKDLEKDEEKGFKGTEVNLEDLIGDAKSWRQRASDLLVVGSKWIVGASDWVVKSRSENTAEKRIQITLECVSLLGVPEIGLAGTRNVREGLGGDEGTAQNPRKHCGPNFYSLCALNVATIRPVRRDAEVIELGIKSQVFNRAAGLCNFNAIPSADSLFKLDKKDITLTTGRMDRYFQRSSFFSVHVRPVKEYGQPQAGFVKMPLIFCVQGNAPITQSNFLRIRPQTSGYFEYRLIPRTGADININNKDTDVVIVLKASEGVAYTNDSKIIGESVSTKYGDFQITTQGIKAKVGDITTNDELFTKPGESEFIEVETQVPDDVERTDIASDTGSVFLIKHAWAYHFLGTPKRENRGITKTVEHRHYKENGDKFITVSITADSVYGTIGQDIGQGYYDALPGHYYWANVRFGVTESTGDWSKGGNDDRFTITADLRPDNPFGNAGGYSKVHSAFDVTSRKVVTTSTTKGGERVFEKASQIADVSHYTELTKSNDSGPEHEVTFVNEYISNKTLAQYDDMSTIGFTVKSSGEIAGIEQLRLWSQTGINVTRLIEGDNAPSNLFADLVFYLLKNTSQGVGNVVPAELVDEDSLRATARFLRANKIFYDGVIEDSESFRTFIYDNAPLQLCSFTIKNGRFGMIPALPVDSNDEISLQPITVEQIFTAGNIIENSLQLQYIDVSQRSNIRALVTWRVTVQNDLPYQASALVYWSDFGVNERSTTEQSFDLSEFCTNREQALRTARFLLSVRRRVTKTVSFKTVPDALGVQPGSYIRVITEASTYNSTANGSITDAGTLVSITTVEDGDYEALVYNPTTQEVTETTITIANNAVSDSQYHGSLFTLLSGSTDYSVYQIESLNLEEDGLVSISAVEVPTDASGVSIVAKDVLTESNFTVLE
jgi:hypothetical protein